MQRAERAGARIVKSAQQALYGGHPGYFQHPHGHLWEVGFNRTWRRWVDAHSADGPHLVESRRHISFTRDSSHQSAGWRAIPLRAQPMR